MGYNLKQAATNNTNGFKALPEDRYLVIIEDGKATKTKLGKDMINWTLKIVKGKYENRKIWVNSNLEGIGLSILSSIASACNSDICEKDDVSIEEIIKALRGKKCSAFIEPDRVLDNGKQTYKVSGYKKIETASTNVPDNIADDVMLDTEVDGSVLF